MSCQACVQMYLSPCSQPHVDTILTCSNSSMHLADELQAGKLSLQQQAVADRPPVAQLSSQVYTPRSTLWTPPAAKPDPLAEAQAAAAAGRGSLTARGQRDIVDTQPAGVPAAGRWPLQQPEGWETVAGANPWQDEQPLHPLHHQFVLREAKATDRSAGGLLMLLRLGRHYPATAAMHIIMAAPVVCWHDRTAGDVEVCTEHAGCTALSEVCCHLCA